jgi:hypothetical protein
MKHVHAEKILAYAQDAMETDKPWERWEYLAIECYHEWQQCEGHPAWIAKNDYRRKARTININGFEVPEPVREPLGESDAYYYVSFESLFTDNGASESRWYEAAGVSRLRLDKGIIHLTREAAELHAKALLSFTENP